MLLSMTNAQNRPRTLAISKFVSQTDATAIGDDNDFVVEGIIDVGRPLNTV
jgi:hypothetical protein